MNTRKVCPECLEVDCPGRILCPQCGVSDHGTDAETSVADHGKCYTCHKMWQLGMEV